VGGFDNSCDKFVIDVHFKWMFVGIDRAIKDVKWKGKRDTSKI